MLSGVVCEPQRLFFFSAIHEWSLHGAFFPIERMKHTKEPLVGRHCCFHCARQQTPVRVHARPGCVMFMFRMEIWRVIKIDGFIRDFHLDENDVLCKKTQDEAIESSLLRTISHTHTAGYRLEVRCARCLLSTMIICVFYFDFSPCVVLHKHGRW